MFSWDQAKVEIKQFKLRQKNTLLLGVSFVSGEQNDIKNARNIEIEVSNLFGEKPNKVDIGLFTELCEHIQQLDQHRKQHKKVKKFVKL